MYSIAGFCRSVFRLHKRPHADRQHVNRSQQCGNHQCDHPDHRQRMRAVQRSLYQIPFADEAGQSGDAHQRQSGDGKDGKRLRHLFSQAVKLVNVLPAALADDRACAEEGTDLDHRMADHMCQSTDQTERRHQRNAKQNIREIAHRRPGQPPFQMRFL